MGYLRLDDKVFEQKISLREAYEILEAFVVQYNARGESSTVALMTDIGVSDGGTPSDPAQIYDFVVVASRILGNERLLELASRAD